MGLLKEKRCANCEEHFAPRKERQLCCSRSCSNKYQAHIRKTTIDKESGLTLAELYHIKSQNTLIKTWYGTEKHKNLARSNLEKTRKTDSFVASAKAAYIKRSIKDKSGTSPAQRSTQKALKTKSERGIVTPIHHKSEFERYKHACWVYTRRKDLSFLENFEKRGRAGSSGAYHLDHKISIFDGFHNNIDPKFIGSIENLQFIPWEENASKNYRSVGLSETSSLVVIEKFEVPDTTTQLNSIRITCEHCNKTTNSGNYHRWHGNKCKHAT